ncbi:MAG: hypothetical protein NVS2B14_18640 [Chamaesiphon sp.]
MWKPSLGRGILIVISTSLAFISYPDRSLKTLAQYQGALVYDRKPAATHPKPTASGSLIANSRVFSVPIKSRPGGIPLIDVTFNGKQKFPMLLDTGASHTLLTRRMAMKLKVPIVSTTHFRTANGVAKLSVGFVKSIQVGRGIVRNRLVGIAQSDLTIGLLGQDFYSNYDITIKRAVVEFRHH